MRPFLLAVICALSSFAQPYTISTISGIDRSANGLQATFDRFGYITGVAVDQAGNLYFDDWAGRRVYRIGPGGIVTLVAGSGAPTSDPSPNGVPATSVPINDPEGVAADSQRNVYILQPNLHQIQKVSADGLITTFAGASPGSSDDGIPATSANLAQCYSIAADASGNVFLNDGPRLRKVD
jgi:sugar lactone lactonase YvrE